MSNMFITASTDTEAVSSLILKIDSAIAPSLILDDAVAFLLNRIRTRFLQEKDPDNVAWPPSKAAVKRRSHGGTGTLFNTGRLFHSIQGAGTGDNQRIIGTDVPYAKYMQNGSYHNVPRIFIGIGGGDAQMASDYLMRKIQDRIGL